MFRSPPETWSEVTSGISTLQNRGRTGWPNPARTLQRPTALSIWMPLISCYSRWKGLGVRHKCQKRKLYNRNSKQFIKIIEDFTFHISAVLSFKRGFANTIMIKTKYKMETTGYETKNLFQDCLMSFHYDFNYLFIIMQFFFPTQ